MSVSVGHHSQGAAASARSADKAAGRAATTTVNKLQPTPEQIRLAQISQKSEQEDDLRSKVTMVAALANCDAETASFALHDCGLDVQAAVNKLLEEGDEEFRQQVITKKKSGKGVVGAGEPSAGAESNANGKENNGIQAEASADRGVRRTGNRLNAPPRMQSNRGGSSTRGRNDFSNNVPSSDTKDASDLNGDVDQDVSMHPRGSGRGRGRGRGGWHSTRGPRNFSRPSRYDRSQVAAASGSADGAAETGQQLHVDGLADAVLQGGGSRSSNGGHRPPVGAGGRGPAGLDGVNSWEPDGDEWTGSLKESQVFTARALDGAAASMTLQQGMTIDSNGGSFGAATFNGPTNALSSSLPAGNNAYSNVAAAVESGNTVQATHREGGVVRHASATDDLSRPLSGAVAGGNVERMQVPFASTADQAMYINTVYDRQLASDTIKNAIGIPTSVHTIPMPASSSASAGSAPGATQAPTSQQLPSKTKTPKTKLPPPTRIPTAAVEMPHKTNSVPTHVLSVQFGNLDLGPEAAAPLDVIRDKQQQATTPVPSSLAKTPASSAVGLSGVPVTVTSISNLSVTGAPSGAVASGPVAAVANLQSKASEVTRLAPPDQQTGAGSGLSQQAVASAVSLSHAHSSQSTSAAPQHLSTVPLSQSNYLPPAGSQVANGSAVSAQQQPPAVSNQYAASVHVLPPPQQPAMSASPVAASRQSASSTGVAAAITSPSSLPITTAAPFSASALNAAMFAAGSGIGALPPAAAAGSHLYGNYPQMFATLPPNMGAGAGGYSGLQNATFANMGYMADGSIYTSHYYGDASYDAAGGNPLGGSGVVSASAASSMQSAPVGSSSNSGSTSAASATAAGSRATSATGKQPPPAPGLPPGIGLPLHSAAAATYMNMPAPGHMTIGGAPYFAGAMYSYDDFQKLQHSMAYYDPSQYQMISSQAAGPAGQFTVGADGKIGLLDGGQQGMVAGGAAGAGAQLTSGAAGQPQSAVTTGAAAAAGGSSAAAAAAAAAAAGIPLPQHYGAAGGSPAGGAAAGAAGLHHGYPQYYIPYSPSVFPAAIHSNTGLGAAALGGAAAGVNYAKGSGYGSLYQPSASAVTVGGTAGGAYDDVGHMQDYGSKAAHVYNSSAGQQGSAKSSVANMSTMPAGGSTGGVASVTHSGSSVADVAALYRHPMTPVAAYAHANPNSHLSSQTGGPMSGFGPYLMTQQQVVMQSSQGGSQDSGASGRSGHAQQMSAATGAKALGNSSGGAGKTSGQYSSGGAGSWPQY